MALFTVIRTFVLSIIFDMILPSGDVYSDITMMYQTWTFRNTESLELEGCKSCYLKTVEDLVPSKKDCTFCITKNNNFHCGGRLPSMKQLLGVENSNECEDMKWVFSPKGMEDSESGKCGEKRTLITKTFVSPSLMVNSD